MDDHPKPAIPDRTNWHAARRVEAMDRHVAARIRQRRRAMGLSQRDLADRLGIGQAQAHKIEYGVNKITAGRLHEIAVVLDARPDWFFEPDGPELICPDLTLNANACLELERNFARIIDDDRRAALCALARSMARRRGKAHRETEDSVGQANVSEVDHSD